MTKVARLGPDPLETFDVRCEQRTARNPTEMNDRRSKGWHAVNVWINQHVVIEAKDRVVQHR